MKLRSNYAIISPVGKELKILPSQDFTGGLQITALNGAKNLGSLDYVVHPDTGIIDIELIATDPANNGTGLLLLRKFVSEVGPLQKISAGITNARTWRYFEESEILQWVTVTEKLNIVHSADIARVPIAHFLQKGGIEVQQISIAKKNFGKEFKMSTTQDYERVKQRWLAEGNDIDVFGSWFFNATLHGTT